MSNRIYRLVLVVFSRLIILAAFYKEIMLFFNTFPSLLSRGLGSPYLFLTNVSYVILLTISILALVAIAIGNIYAFAIAVIISAFTCYKPCLPLTQIIFFLLYLAIDTVTNSYRGLEHVSIRTRFRDIAKSLPIPLIPIVSSTVVAVLVIFTIISIVNRFTDIPRSNPQLYTVMASPITKIVVSLAGVIYAYNIVRKVAEIVAVFVMPSPRVALQELSKEKDIDLIFIPAFRWLLYLAFAAILYTPVYTIVFDILLIDLLKGLSDLMKSIVSAITYVSLVILCRSLDIFSDIHLGVKRFAVTSTALLILVYVAAVKLALPYHGWGAVLAPDIQKLGEVVQKNYIDFGTTVITFISTFFKLLGVAP